MIRRQPRGRPESGDMFPALRREVASPRQRVIWTLTTFTKLLLFVLVFSYVGVSIYLPVNIGDASRDVPQVQAQIGPDHEDVRFQPRDDPLILHGWLFHAKHPNGRSVIFVTGWKAVRVDAVSLPVAHELVAAGYDVLLFDTRGSGEASGGRGTLGNLERRDVLGAYDMMVDRGYKPARMTIYGVSAGAAAVMLDTALLTQVGAIVCDSGYARLRPLIDDGWSARTHLPAGSDWLSIQIGRLLDIDAELDPSAVVAANPARAFLFLHAQGDSLIPVDNARQLRAASKNTQSKLLILAAGTAHIDTYHSDPKTYMATVLAFVDQQIAAHGG